MLDVLKGSNVVVNPSSIVEIFRRGICGIAVDTPVGEVFVLQGVVAIVVVSEVRIRNCCNVEPDAAGVVVVISVCGSGVL